MLESLEWTIKIYGWRSIYLEKVLDRKNLIFHILNKTVVSCLRCLVVRSINSGICVLAWHTVWSIWYQYPHELCFKGFCARKMKTFKNHDGLAEQEKEEIF